jgi:hypothetical protein
MSISKCHTCIHFSGMTYLPFCKKIMLRPSETITREGNKIYITTPTYDWCRNVYCEGGQCGPEGKLYTKAPSGLNIKPIIPIIENGKVNEIYKRFGY